MKQVWKINLDNFFHTLEQCRVVLILLIPILQFDKYFIYKISAHVWYFLQRHMCLEPFAMSNMGLFYCFFFFQKLNI